MMSFNLVVLALLLSALSALAGPKCDITGTPRSIDSCIADAPAGYPQLDVVEANSTPHFDGTFTVSKVVRVKSVLTPQILIVEVFAKEIVRWEIMAYEQRGVKLAPDVDLVNVKSTAIAHPYGHYRITVTTRQDADVRFNLRFE